MSDQHAKSGWRRSQEFSISGGLSNGISNEALSVFSFASYQPETIQNPSNELKKLERDIGHAIGKNEANWLNRAFIKLMKNIWLSEALTSTDMGSLRHTSESRWRSGVAITQTTDASVTLSSSQVTRLSEKASDYHHTLREINKENCLEDGISFIPLKFKDPTAEAEFAFNINQRFEWRFDLLRFFPNLALIIGYILFTLNIAMTKIGIHNITFLLTYNLALLVPVFGVGFLQYFRKFSYVSRNREWLCYLALSGFATYSCLFIPIWKYILEDPKEYIKALTSYNTATGIPLRDNLDASGAEAVKTTYLFSLELFLNSWTAAATYYVFFQFCVCFPGRIRLSIYYQYFYGLLLIPSVIISCVYCRLLLLPALLLLIFFVMNQAVGHMGAYFQELQRRGTFYSWFLLKKFSKTLEESIKKKRGSMSNTSGIVKVQQLFIDLQVILVKAKVASTTREASKLIKDGLGTINKIMRTISSSKDLYKAVVRDDLKDENYIRALNVVEDTRESLLDSADIDAPTVKDKTFFMGSQPKQGTKFDGFKAYKGHIFSSAIPSRASELMRRIGVDLDFNILDLYRSILENDKDGSSILMEVGYVLLVRFLADLGCGKDQLHSFLHLVARNYQTQPYHNSTHGAAVAHLMSIFSRASGVNRTLNSLGLAASNVAALCHDVGHPGRNNGFFTRNVLQLAVIYNDISVLENFHAALTFKFLADPESDIFMKLTINERQVVRANIVRLILATDMKTHFDAVSRLKGVVDAMNANSDEPPDNWFLAEMCMRAADIGHSVLNWNQHYEWSCRVSCEFYLQGDEELSMQTAISPLCDREQHENMAKSQNGFLLHLVRPLLVQLNELITSRKQFERMLNNLKHNADVWLKYHDAKVIIEFPPDVIEIEKLCQKGFTLDLDLLI